jgi:hypothetical protein
VSTGVVRTSDVRSGTSDPSSVLAAVRGIEVEVAGPDAAAADVIDYTVSQYFVSARRGPVGAFGPSN